LVERLLGRADRQRGQYRAQPDLAGRVEGAETEEVISDRLSVISEKSSLCEEAALF